MKLFFNWKGRRSAVYWKILTNETFVKIEMQKFSCLELNIYTGRSKLHKIFNQTLESEVMFVIYRLLILKIFILCKIYYCALIQDVTLERFDVSVQNILF